MKLKPTWKRSNSELTFNGFKHISKHCAVIPVNVLPLTHPPLLEDRNDQRNCMPDHWPPSQIYFMSSSSWSNQCDRDHPTRSVIHSKLLLIYFPFTSNMYSLSNRDEKNTEKHRFSYLNWIKRQLTLSNPFNRTHLRVSYSCTLHLRIHVVFYLQTEKEWEPF